MRVVIVGVLNLSGVWESGMTGLMDVGGAWKEAWLGHPSNWGEEEEGLVMGRGENCGVRRKQKSEQAGPSDDPQVRVDPFYQPHVVLGSSGLLSLQMEKWEWS